MFAFFLVSGMDARTLFAPRDSVFAGRPDLFGGEAWCFRIRIGKSGERGDEKKTAVGSEWGWFLNREFSARVSIF